MNIISIKFQNDTNVNKPVNQTSQSNGNHRLIQPSNLTADSKEGRSFDQTSNYWEDFVTKETTRRAAIEELERVIRQMTEESSIKVNVNLETQENDIQVYQDQMERHQTPTKLSQPLFSSPTLIHLQGQIAEFGEVREWELDYCLKKQPVLAVGKKGYANDELHQPRGLALDETIS